MKCKDLKAVTIVSRDGGDRARAPPDVPLQVEYTGSASVIPSTLADVPCSDLGISGLLAKLNYLLGTRNHDDVLEPRSVDTICAGARRKLLQNFIDDDFDFGMAYARLRPWWQLDPDIAQRELARRERKDIDLRNVSAYSTIYSENLFITPPRRIWDLYANRVIPTWTVVDIGSDFLYSELEKLNIVAVSHSWMAENLRHGFGTQINSYEWPVSIPKNITLESVRIELLNHGLEYAWLDVLCMRQPWEEPDSEEKRVKEWRFDLPTFGNVYQQGKKVIYYFSGLGQPFQIEDINNDRHWLNRAWTLQEIHPNRVVAGITDNSPVYDMPQIQNYQKDMQIDEEVRQFYDRLAKLTDITKGNRSIFRVLDAMRHRVSSKEEDKIHGIAYLSRSQSLPTYETDETIDNAWDRFLESLSDYYRGELLFLFPTPGNGKCVWGPSWQQVKDARVLPDCVDPRLFDCVHYDSVSLSYYYRGFRLDGCYLDGIAETRHTFSILANHSIPIPQGFYVLIGSLQHTYWVVGISKDEETVEKVSVVSLEGAVANEKIKMLGLGRAVECKLA